jgi:phosphoserine phosphatase
MQFALTLVSPDAEAVDAARSLVEQAVHDLGAHIRETRYLGPNALDKRIEGADARALRAAAEAAVADLPVDLCVQPLENRRKRLLIADMDSTIIGCECLDELADFAGRKAEIAAITERAMRGELAFEGALRERVGMLKGLSTQALQRCFDERVRLNPGAATLVRTMAAGGARCVLVSGGFEFFTGRVAAAAGFQANRANRLIEAEGALTGQVGEPILGREAKLAALKEETAALGLPLSAALAVGDGANDLAMIEAAGLGVAYRAKPIVAEQADARVDHADLTALLYFQGYPAESFVAG